jgi:hypothetical protein
MGPTAPGLVVGWFDCGGADEIVDDEHVWDCGLADSFAQEEVQEEV